MVEMEIDLGTLLIVIANVIAIVGAVVGLYVKITHRIIKLEFQVNQLCRHVDRYYAAWTSGNRKQNDQA